MRRSSRSLSELGCLSPATLSHKQADLAAQLSAEKLLRRQQFRTTLSTPPASSFIPASTHFVYLYLLRVMHNINLYYVQSRRVLLMVEHFINWINTTYFVSDAATDAILSILQTKEECVRSRFSKCCSAFLLGIRRSVLEVNVENM